MGQQCLVGVSFLIQTQLEQAQEFFVGTWTEGAPDGLDTLKPAFPSYGIYKVRLNPDSTLLPLNHIQITNLSWLVFAKNHQYLMQLMKTMAIFSVRYRHLKLIKKEI